MSDMGKGNSGQPVSPEPGETYVTLEPIRTGGPDSLDPTGIPEIVQPTLREIEISWKTLRHPTAVFRADDLLDCGPPGGPPFSPLPDTGTITRAVFDVQFADSPEPRTVTVCLPGTVILQRSEDAAAVFRWLDKCRIRLTRKLAQFILVLSLSIIAAAGSPLLDDDTDDDDDDDDPDPPTQAFGL